MRLKLLNNRKFHDHPLFVTVHNCVMDYYNKYSARDVTTTALHQTTNFLCPTVNVYITNNCNNNNNNNGVLVSHIDGGTYSKRFRE